MSQLTEALFTVWPFIWVNDFLRYLLAAGAMNIAIVMFAAWARRRKTQTRTATGQDVRREILYSLSTITIFSLVGFMLYLTRDGGVFQLYLDPVSVSAVVGEFVVMVLLHDAYFYGIHRAMHHPLLYRRFHRVHHLSRTPTPWAAYAFAPAEAVLEAAILPLVALVMPLSAVTVFLFTTHMIVRNAMGHAGVEIFPRGWLDWPLLRWITTTTHHDLHHETFRANFGLYFTWWDKLFGTEHADYADRFRTNAGVRRAVPRVSKGIAAVFVAGIGLSLLASPQAQAEANAVAGFWITPYYRSVVHVSPCDEALCAEIVWLWEVEKTGVPLRDVENPDRSRRQDPLLGREIFTGFQYDDEQWQGGRIYNPDDGRKYRASVELLTRDVLSVKGCWGPFCQSQQWRRIGSMPCGSELTR